MTSVNEEVLEDVHEEVPVSLARVRVCRLGEDPEDSGEVPPQVPSFPRVRAWAVNAQASAAALLEKPGTLLHAQPPTFRQAHVRHRECAGHYGHPAASRSRAVYGYGHMLAIKAPLNYIEWATDSPLRGTIHVLLGLAVWLGLLLGGYL